ncbi:MAG: ribosome silencing factor [Ruminococcaceae bacterium]|nr:ribosome silencing factor [Oscillospiraceae bacterium]
MDFKERITAELETPDSQPAPLTDATPAELAEAIALFLDNKRGRQIKIIPMKGKSDICDFMVLATGTSNTHVQTLGREVEYEMGRRSMDPLHVEGRDNNTWSVLDYSHVLVHVFTRETRDFYNLDKLYGDN